MQTAPFKKTGIGFFKKWDKIGILMCRPNSQNESDLISGSDSASLVQPSLISFY